MTSTTELICLKTTRASLEVEYERLESDCARLRSLSAFAVARLNAVHAQYSLNVTPDIYDNILTPIYSRMMEVFMQEMAVHAKQAAVNREIITLNTRIRAGA